MTGARSVLHTGNTLSGVTEHSRRFHPVIRAGMGSGWWLWLLETTTAGFSFCCSLSSALLPALPLCDCSNPPDTAVSVILHAFGHCIFPLNLNFPFLIFFFHVTVSFGGLTNPLTLVFTPLQHQQGAPMIWGRHHFTALYYSLHILFILHEPFSQASSSIYSSLF